MLELADIFRRYGQKYRDKFKKGILPSHLKAMTDIENCRTELMGGHLYFCDNCQTEHYSYHSCKNRHCPKCQNDQTTTWIQKQKKSLLPVTYHLVTFTLPQELRKVSRSNQKTIYDLLFKTSAKALQKLAWDKRFIGGLLGMLGVLHTWKRDMGYHVHLHYIVPGGGLSKCNSTWMPAKNDFLVYVPLLSNIFRAKFRDELKKTTLFDEVPKQVWRKEWVVHSKPVGKGEKALEYLSKYIYRVALSNNRLIRLLNDRVTFRYQDSQTKEWKTPTIPAMEFMRRFLQHVLPGGFQKVRRYGFLAPNKKNTLGIIQYILRPKGILEKLNSQEKRQFTCPKCGKPLKCIGRIPKSKRAPP